MNQDGKPVYNNQENENNEQKLNDEFINPVGELLEFTQKYSIRPPVFEFGKEEGPPHNKQFVCNVKLGQCEEVGMGRAKKDAKRQAAIKLLNKIKSNSLNISCFGVDTANIADSDNRSDMINSNSLLYQQMSKDKRNTKNIQNSFNLFKHSDKPLIKDLLTNPNSLSHDETSDSNCKYFSDLAKELNFEFQYFEIPVLSKSGI